MDLYECTLTSRYLEVAAKLQHTLDADFWNGRDAYYVSAKGETEASFSLNDEDSALPSASSVTLANLIRLSALVGGYDGKIHALVKSRSHQLLSAPQAVPLALSSFFMKLAGPVKIGSASVDESVRGVYAFPFKVLASSEQPTVCYHKGCVEIANLPELAAALAEMVSLCTK